MDKADFHLRLVLRSRKSGATPPFRHMSSWRAERQVDFVTNIYVYIGRQIQWREGFVHKSIIIIIIGFVFRNCSVCLPRHNHMSSRIVNRAVNELLFFKFCYLSFGLKLSKFSRNHRIWSLTQNAMLLQMGNCAFAHRMYSRKKNGNFVRPISSTSLDTIFFITEVSSNFFCDVTQNWRGGGDSKCTVRLNPAFSLIPLCWIILWDALLLMCPTTVGVQPEFQLMLPLLWAHGAFLFDEVKLVSSQNAPTNSPVAYQP